MNPRNLPRARRGFTMIEMLVVIAIIAILAGLLFPVMNSVRENARQGQCSSNLHSIIMAMKMYREDWRVYPEALYGYAAVAPGSPCPAGLTSGIPNPRLFLPDYVKDEKIFNCPNSPVKLNNRDTFDAVNRMTSQPHVDNPTTPTFQYCYYGWDSYDFQFRPYTNSTGQREIHYTKKWTTVGASVGDDRRQLIYRDPPDNTVVTWCHYHTNMDSSGNPARETKAIVAFLSGRVQKLDAQSVNDWSGGAPYPWQVSPRP
jgi:prepilin-type N-terminal cleavage/methylation domain-containing protein